MLRFAWYTADSIRDSIQTKKTIRRSLIFNQLFSENNLVALTFCININKLYKCELIQCQLLLNTSAACITCHLITKWNICISYTLRVKKTCHSIFVHNFDQSQLTCKILSQVAPRLTTTFPPTQYRLWETVFTGQKTQPTVSKY